MVPDWKQFPKWLSVWFGFAIFVLGVLEAALPALQGKVPAAVYSALGVAVIIGRIVNQKVNSVPDVVKGSSTLLVLLFLAGCSKLGAPPELPSQLAEASRDATKTCALVSAYGLDETRPELDTLCTEIERLKAAAAAVADCPAK